MPCTIRPLQAPDLQALREIREFAFLDHIDYDVPERRERFLDYLRFMSAVFVDGAMVAAGAILPFTMHHGGQVVKMSGLASVVSAGAHRRSGYVRDLLHSMLADLRDQQVGWCLEYPFDARFYAKYGWQTISNGSFVEIEADYFRSKGPARDVRRINPKSQADLAILCTIYEQFAKRFNFTMTRDEAVRPAWQKILIGDPRRPISPGRFTFIIKDHAYCVLHIRRDGGRGEVARVLDWAYSTPAGRHELFHFWGTLSGQIKRLEIQFPQDDPLLVDLSPFLTANPHPIQARIVDVASALTAIPYRGAPFDINLAVSDQFCQWNDATFQITCENDGLHAKKVDQAADVEITIEALALLVSGTPVDPRRTGIISGDEKAISRLTSLSTHPCYVPLCDYF